MVLRSAYRLWRRICRPTGHFTPAIAWQLVDALYLEDARVIHGAVLLVAAAALAYLRTRSTWLLLWGALSLPIAAWRLRSARAYRRQDHSGSPDEWARRSLAGAWLSGALWGCASIVIVVETDPFVQFLLIVCQTAFVQGGAVRNSSVPVVANGQALFASVPLAIAALMVPDLYYKLFSIFVLFHILTVRLIVQVVHRQMLAYLVVNNKLDTLATTDALTLLLNRRGFDNRMRQEWQRCRGDQMPLSLLIVDIDHFKPFNDAYGHQAGDACLQRVGQAISDGTRRMTDSVARYGGGGIRGHSPEYGRGGHGPRCRPDSGAGGSGCLGAHLLFIRAPHDFDRRCQRETRGGYLDIGDDPSGGRSTLQGKACRTQSGNSSDGKKRKHRAMPSGWAKLPLMPAPDGLGS